MAAMVRARDRQNSLATRSGPDHDPPTPIEHAAPDDHHGHQEATMRAWLAAAAFAPAIVLSLAHANRAGAAYTCSTVARNGQLDPDGQVLSPAFVDRTAINAAGDVVLMGRPRAGRTSVYLYPGAGAPITIARGNGMAPNGGVFRASSAFRDVSINDAGDVAFLARLSPGQGVFARVGGVFETAATTPSLSPNGGIFTQISAASRLNASGTIAFLATVAGAPSGVFAYDTTSDSLTTVLEVDDVTSGGRELCSFQAVALGDSGAIAIEATSKLDCADGMESSVAGIFLHDGVTTDEVALIGDASPVLGSTYSDFGLGLFVTASNEVGFRADVAGLMTVGGVFLTDPSIPATTLLVSRGDASPAGGAIGKIAGFEIPDDGSVVFRSALSGSPERFGVFSFGTSDATVLVKSSPPPLDAFGPGAAFNNLAVPAVSRDAAWVAVHARVRDDVAPRGKRGVLRCTQ
jgi:hypothetical protein